MRIPSHIPPTIFETFPRAVARHGTSKQILSSAPTSHTPTPTTSTSFLQSRPVTMSNNQSSSTTPSFSDYKIETTTIPTAAGVDLSDIQKVITGSIFDLFAGRPSLRILTLWTDDAVFTDPLTIAEGRKQYSAQWYGLPTAFSDIQRLQGQVISAGNPIEIHLKTKYTVKGLGSEQTIDSKVKVFTEGQGPSMRIKRVEDRWDDSLPDGVFKNALRNLNSVTVPTMVSVPKSIEEEESSK